MKKLITFAFLLVSSLIFSACTYTPVNTSKTDTVSPDVLNQPIPTIDIMTEDPADQALIDELNQYQDKSFDKDFTDLESQF